MRNRFFAVCLLAAPALVLAATLKPEQANYAVSRDGKIIGTASYALGANADGSWTLHSETRGTGGMARLLGLDVREDSTFALREGQLQGLRYSYEQDAAIRHKRRRIDFDWNAQQIRVHDNGKDFRYAPRPGTIDRSTVAVALGIALANGETSITLPVAVRDRVEMQRYAASGTAPISLPAGKFDAIEIDRTDTPGKVMKSWYAADTGLLPVRVEQKQHDGSIIVMQLRK
ncbi:MAG: DUF3108 domain-containing protein [Xanthomonadaceae bacterium]|nr:DUF3108 domain-containing protein [Xanthomonadaceae bacterium]MDE1960457.1 DUF3108 domain-containing protein [Xanthomonadaceae bacterium]